MGSGLRVAPSPQPIAGRRRRQPAAPEGTAALPILENHSAVFGACGRKRFPEFTGVKDSRIFPGSRKEALKSGPRHAKGCSVGGSMGCDLAGSYFRKH